MGEGVVEHCCKRLVLVTGVGGPSDAAGEVSFVVRWGSPGAQIAPRRAANEPVERCLERFRASLSRACGGAREKRSRRAVPGVAGSGVPQELFFASADGSRLDSKRELGAVLREAAFLVVDGERSRVLPFAPLPPAVPLFHAIAGAPVVPAFAAAAAACPLRPSTPPDAAPGPRPADLQCEWYVSEAGAGGEVAAGGAGGDFAAGGAVSGRGAGNGAAGAAGAAAAKSFRGCAAGAAGAEAAAPARAESEAALVGAGGAAHAAAGAGVAPASCRSGAAASPPPEPAVCVARALVFAPGPAAVGRKLYMRVFHSQLPCVDAWSLPIPVRQPSPDSWHLRRLVDFGGAAAAAAAAAAAVSSPVSVLSYNILADDYARTPHATQRCYPYASAETLSFKNRAPLILRDIQAAAPDVVCLQECTASFFELALNPCFSDRYHLFFKRKVGRVAEGCALLLNRSKFEPVLDLTPAKISGVFREDFTELLPECREIFRTWPGFEETILPNLTTVFQIVVARVRRAKAPAYAVFGNTHLFFHPWAAHIRILQTLALLRLLAQTVGAVRASAAPGAAAQIGVFLAGDLNAFPASAAYQLLRTGAVSAGHPDWLFAGKFTWHDEEEAEGVISGGATTTADEVGGKQDAGTKCEKEADGETCGRDTASIVMRESGSKMTLPLGETAENDSPEACETVPSARPALKAQPSRERLANSSGEPLAFGFDAHMPAIFASRDLRLQDAFIAQPNPFTNAVRGFEATLDHIFFAGSPDAAVCALTPPPSRDAVYGPNGDGGLPSPECPSDHVPIGAAVAGLFTPEMPVR